MLDAALTSDSVELVKPKFSGNSPDPWRQELSGSVRTFTPNFCRRFSLCETECIGVFWWERWRLFPRVLVRGGGHSDDPETLLWSHSVSDNSDTSGGRLIYTRPPETRAGTTYLINISHVRKKQLVVRESVTDKQQSQNNK